MHGEVKHLTGLTLGHLKLACWCTHDHTGTGLTKSS